MPRVKLFDEAEVLEKAMILFWKKGYYATSIQDLVNHLKINRASLYDTFGGKKKLFDKAFAHYRTISTQSLAQFLESHSNVKKGFKALFTSAIQQCQLDRDKKGCFVVNTTIELIPNEKKSFTIVSEHRKQIEKIFYDYLLLGKKNGQLSKEKNLKAIATLFFTFYNGLKVVTKVEFKSKQFLASVDSLLTVLD